MMISSFTCRFLLFSISMVNFAMPNSVLMSWLYILTVYIRVSKSFSFYTNTLMLSMYVRLLSFCCDLLSLYSAVHSLHDIFAIANSNGDWAFPWIYLSGSLPSLCFFPPVVNSTRQVFMVFSIKFTTSSDILNILRQFIIQLCRTISYAFLLWIHAITRLFRLVLF